MTHLRARVGVAEAELGLLEQTTGEGLDELSQVQTDTAADLAHGLVGAARNAQALLNGRRKRRFNL